MPHHYYLNKAFQLALQANAKQIRPNPFVGAVLVDEDGVVIGEGFHQEIGGYHAEVSAINAALQLTSELSKTTLYVTLEPCSHFGKTPPCTELIIEKKIPKVVIASRDPNPKVSGVHQLRKMGVEVIEIIIPEIEKMNQTFFVNQQKKRPFIQLKMAITLNGKIADRYGNSKWISNEASRKYVHSVLRNNSDAIFTTASNVIKDDATLNIRINEDIKELSVIIIDRDLDLLKPQNKFLSIFYKRNTSKIYLLSNVTVEKLPLNVELLYIDFDDNGKMKIDGLGEKLLQLGIHQILVESGSKLSTYLIENDWADELYVFVAPKLLLDKNAINFFEFEKEQLLIDSTNLCLDKTNILGDDVVLTYTFLKST